MKNFKKGFTLIELLVVVAIIGILATVVLASLGSARAKAIDAKVKAELRTFDTTTVMFLDEQTVSVFDDLCTDTRIIAILASIQNQTGYSPDCDAFGDAWAVEAQINQNEYTCRDSTGFNRTSSTYKGSNSTYCDDANNSL